MKNCKLLAALTISAALTVSCNKATVEGSFSSVPSSRKITARMFDKSGMKVLDTVKLSDDGRFKYDFKVRKGEPEFLYFYYGEVKLASLLLDKGDRVKVECDTLGQWSVEGSEDCEYLRENEMALAKLSSSANLTLRDYLGHYRNMMRFVMTHSHSLSVVPVLFQKVGDNPVFSQASDGVIFNSTADSLETVYPKSRYIKILRDEGASRMELFAFQNKLNAAPVSSYPDIQLPDCEGKQAKLSENVDKATLLIFWNADDAVHKMYNLEVLKPLYDKYAPYGFRIYSVNTGADKAVWAMSVKEQGLPWVNVCDTKGSSLAFYGVTEVPTLFLITDDSLERMEKISPDYLSAKVSSCLQ